MVRIGSRIDERHGVMADAMCLDSNTIPESPSRHDGIGGHRS